MTSLIDTTASRPEGQARTLIIDTDTHNFPLPPDIAPYLSETWARYLETFGLRTVGEHGIPRGRLMASRADAWSPRGRPPGNDAEYFVEQLLDRYDVHAAILNNSATFFTGMVGGNQPYAFTEAFVTAVNDWVVAEWLSVDERLYSSITVAVEDPKATVAEIERFGADERFVHLGLPFSTRNPMGARKYWDMFEAASHFGLPLSLHTGNAPMPSTGSGWPSFYFEDHMDRPPSVLAQLASLICEGVFDRFPDLKVVVQEGGWTWAPSYGWLLDSAWRRLRDEEPYPFERAPSEYLRDHVWFTTQPMEETRRPHEFDEVLAMLAKDRLMFASDYPHWDFDPPDRALPTTLAPELRAAVLGGTAAGLYPRLAEGFVA